MSSMANDGLQVNRENRGHETVGPIDEELGDRLPRYVFLDYEI